METRIPALHHLLQGAVLMGVVLPLVTTASIAAQYTYTTLSVPGAVSTDASGISGNNIVGYYYNGSTYEGFLYNGSSYTTFNVLPGAVEETSARGISGGNIVGWYFNGSNDEGFLYNGSTYTTLSVPGAQATQADDISGDEIVGRYWNGSGNLCGFLATPVPEPSFLAFLAVGAVAFLIRRRH